MAIQPHRTPRPRNGLPVLLLAGVVVLLPIVAGIANPTRASKPDDTYSRTSRRLVSAARSHKTNRPSGSQVRLPTLSTAGDSGAGAGVGDLNYSYGPKLS